MHMLCESGGPSSVEALQQHLESVDVTLLVFDIRHNPDIAKVSKPANVYDVILPFPFLMLVQD